MPDIPLREFLETLISERTGRVEAALDAHHAVHVQEEQARAEAAKRIDNRLEQLNELRQEVMTDRARLVNREAFDAKMEALDTRIDSLHDQITEWKGREKGLSLVASLAVGTIGVVGTLLAVYFAFSG